MKINERGQYDGIIIGARCEGALLCRIHDSAYTGKKPFDMFGILPSGKAIAVEVKEVEKLPRDVIKLLERHQVTWLKNYAKRGGKALLVVHCLGDDICYVWEMTLNGELKEKLPLFKVESRWLGLVQNCD